MSKQLDEVAFAPAEASVAAGAEEAVERLFASLVRFTRRVHATAQQWAQPAYDLTRSEVAILRLLDTEVECRPGTLACRQNVGPSVVSRQLATLTERGMVARRPDPDDGRAELVSLTARGRQTLTAIRDAYLQQFQERLAGWELDRVQEAADLVDHLTELLLPGDPEGAPHLDQHDPKGHA